MASELPRLLVEWFGYSRSLHRHHQFRAVAVEDEEESGPCYVLEVAAGHDSMGEPNWLTLPAFIRRRRSSENNIDAVMFTDAMALGLVEHFIGKAGDADGGEELPAPTPPTRFPTQPLIIDKNGVTRFKANKIVEYLLDAGPFDMNHLGVLPGIESEHYEQFAQLIGYSLTGFGELSYVSDEAYADAERIAKQLLGGEE